MLSKEEDAARTRAWYAANKERVSSKARADRLANPEKYKARYQANKEKRRAYGRAYYHANKERSKASALAWHAANRKKKRGHNQKWTSANREKDYAATRAWVKANPDKALTHKHQRRARKLGAEGHHTAADVAKIRKQQRDRCAALHCQVVLEGKGHVDHIVPLSRGGSNWCTNLQLLCASCNCSKGALTMKEWLARRTQ
jgi:5-methylcytosine-specific restriction endonuclease McrA